MAVNRIYRGVVKPQKHEEHTLQCSCVRWYRLRYPQYTHLLFAVPNGGGRSAIEGSRLKAEGVVAGVADLILLVPHSKPIFLELKTKVGRQSDNQKEWQKAVESVGYVYYVIRDVEAFAQLIETYMSNIDMTV